MRLQDTVDTKRLQIALNSLARLLSAGRQDTAEARDKAVYIISKLQQMYLSRKVNGDNGT